MSRHSTTASPRRDHCPGSGTLPNTEVTEARRAMHGVTDLVPDPLFGRQGCAVCGRVYFIRADGTLPNHSAIRTI
jgi:hypothetical protein